MKTFKFAATVVFLIFTGMMLTAQERETPPLTLDKVSESVYQLMGGSGSNGGVIVGENAVLLIDAKMNEESVNQTIEAVKQLTDKPM